MSMSYKLIIMSILFSLCFQVHAGEYEGIDYVYAKLLLKQNMNHAKIASIGIAETGVSNPLIYDMLAESLNKVSSNKTLDRNTRLWFLKALTKSKNKRYVKIGAKLGRNKKDNMVRKGYRLMKKKMVNKTDPEFVPGSVDMQSIKQELANYRSKGVTDLNVLLAFKACASFDEIVNTLGYPDSVYVGGSLPESTELIINYTDYASIMLTNRGTKSWCFLKSLPAPKALSLEAYADDEKGEVLKMRKRLWSWNTYDLRYTAREALATDVDLDLVLDELALRVWWGKADKDPHTVDGIAYIIKEMNTLPRNRFFDMFFHIRKKIKSFKMRRYAASYLKRVVKDEDDVFDPLSALK